MVAVAVVDLLEAVEVAHQQAEPGAGAPCALQLQLEGLLEAAPVREPGERVGAGGARKLCALLLEARPSPCDRSSDSRERERGDQPDLERPCRRIGLGEQRSGVRGDRGHQDADGGRARQEAEGKDDREEEQQGERRRRLSSHVERKRDEPTGETCEHWQCCARQVVGEQLDDSATKKPAPASASRPAESLPGAGSAASRATTAAPAASA